MCLYLPLFLHIPISYMFNSCVRTWEKSIGIEELREIISKKPNEFE